MTDLYQQWLDAKREEEKANERRVAIESEIVGQYGCKEEGSETHKTDDYKITITGRINRTLDPAAWEGIQHKIPEDRRPVQYKPALDLKGLKYLKENEPKLYRIAAEAITAKPGKPSVKVEKR